MSMAEDQDAAITAFVAGLSTGQRKLLRTLVFLSAGAATQPLLAENPTYVFPAQKVTEAVEFILAGYGAAKP